MMRPTDTFISRAVMTSTSNSSDDLGWIDKLPAMLQGLALSMPTTEQIRNWRSCFDLS
ncbi:hypothetical protein [Paracoccus liaowanqingii]|uniref:hypothetical protein n=1 Tax=Paracoccus liaowanqingii TaxID=2560053 RepID=UPI00143D65A6|nr:hypothetical protein [Paracoccus liaowanqingii]